MIFLLFLLKTDCGYTLRLEAVLTNTHNLCFRAKKMYIPVNRSFLYKSGVQWALHQPGHLPSQSFPCVLNEYLLL